MEDAATMMLQDIYPHSLHNQFTEKSDPLPESPVYVFRRADLLVVESREDARLEDIDQSGEHGKISMPGKDENEKGFYKERGRYLRLPTVKELGEDREYTFLFTMDGFPIRRCGSQGQQKSFLVALKFAQYDIMKKACGQPPSLLLDDLFDKLDMDRVGNMLQMVAGNDFGQIFLSDTDKARTEALVDRITSDRAYFKASSGTFTKIDGEL